MCAFAGMVFPFMIHGFKQIHLLESIFEILTIDLVYNVAAKKLFYHIVHDLIKMAFNIFCHVLRPQTIATAHCVWLNFMGSNNFVKSCQKSSPHVLTASSSVLPFYLTYFLFRSH